jgi:hypothetical protein
VLLNWDAHDSADLQDNLKHGEVSLRSIHDVDTLITAGEYDLNFNHKFLVEGLQTYSAIASVTEDTATPATATRPGELDIAYATGLPYGAGARKVRNPHYLAGHSVSHKQPAQLKQDVMDWLGVMP